MGTTKVESPQIPTQPTSTGSVGEWLANYPKIVEAMGKYNPIEAQQQVDLLNTYGLPMAEAYQAINESLYPQTAGLQEQLAGIASERATGGLPDYLKQQYRDELRANLGTNAGSPIGADYVSRNLLGLGEQYNQYYQNLGLSLAGRQPLTTGQLPQTTNQLSTYTPSSVMGMNTSTYSPYISGWSTAQGIQQQNQMYNQQLPFMYLQGTGNLLQGMSGYGKGFMGWG